MGKIFRFGLQKEVHIYSVKDYYKQSAIFKNNSSLKLEIVAMQLSAATKEFFESMTHKLSVRYAPISVEINQILLVIYS